MKHLFLLLNASQSSGFWWLVFLFIVCFSAVHTVRLIRYALRSKKPAPPPEPKPQPPEPVYYIVEKKKKRPSVKYSVPKEFKFK